MRADNPVVIFGAGAGGRRAAAYCRRARPIQFFADNDVRKHGTRVDGIDVRSPQDILDSPDVTVVVASIYADEIFQQLVTIGVQPQRIEVMNPDALPGTGRDPFPYGFFAVVLGVPACIISALGAVLWVTR
jgi:hypothetical protein